MKSQYMATSIALLAVFHFAGPMSIAQSVSPPADAATQPSADPIADQLAQLKRAIKEDKFADALALMDKLEPALPQPDFYVASNRFRVLIKSKRYDAAYRYAAKIENLPNVTANLLNELALIITDTRDVEERDLIVAKRLARQAMALSNNWPGFTNTLARAYFVNGEYELAVLTETDARDRAPAQWKAAFTHTLEKYQAALRKNSVS
jgi:hypothetical protein